MGRSPHLLSGLLILAVLSCGCQTTPPPPLTALQATLKSLQDDAVTAYELGEYDKAIKGFERIEVLSKGMDDLGHLANAYNNLAAVHFELRSHELALQYLKLALDLNRRSNEPQARRAQAENLLNLGSLYAAMGNQTQAEEHSTQAERLFMDLDDEAGQLQVLRNRGKIQEHLSDFARAIAIYSEALDRARSREDYRLTGSLLADIGGVREKMGEFKKAYELYRSALRIDKEHELFISVAKDLYLLGRVSEKLGDLDQAMEFHLRALNVYKIRISHKPWVISQLRIIIALARKKKDTALLDRHTRLLDKLDPGAGKKEAPPPPAESSGDSK